MNPKANRGHLVMIQLSLRGDRYISRLPRSIRSLYWKSIEAGYRGGAHVQTIRMNLAAEVRRLREVDPVSHAGKGARL